MASIFQSLERTLAAGLVVLIAFIIIFGALGGGYPSGNWAWWILFMKWLHVASGLMWVGQKSIEMGLADALGSVDSVARDVIKAEDVVDFTPHENIAERVARKFGATMADTLVKAATPLGAQLR